mgnify:CR=1 FL=1
MSHSILTSEIWIQINACVLFDCVINMIAIIQGYHFARKLIGHTTCPQYIFSWNCKKCSVKILCQLSSPYAGAYWIILSTPDLGCVKSQKGNTNPYKGFKYGSISKTKINHQPRIIWGGLACPASLYPICVQSEASGLRLARRMRGRLTGQSRGVQYALACVCLVVHQNIHTLQHVIPSTYCS